uniref:K-box domain-containing protein n=1 Tax=Daucus carota subsp. sativus TaxID=79200 RepID=A0A161Y105_DAUCS
MERILERYERYAYAERQLVATDIETQGSWNLEHAKLQARIEVLQKNERHYMGEDLDSLSLKELHNLEHQLDSALKQIRSRKDKNLQEHNNLLLKKANGKEKEIYQPPPVEQQNDGNSSTALPNQLHSVNIGLAQVE